MKSGHEVWGVTMGNHFDVLIVGAGLSGIGAAYRLQTQAPGRTYAVLESRESIGGTWDLFRYPGVRSDSDMFTLGFPFFPWKDPKAIADGPAILSYVRETAATFGIDQRIRFGRRVERASWSSDDALWTVETNQETYTCSFLYVCSGYYNYESGHVVEFPGLDQFRGQVVHPQHWPEDLDYADRRVVVIGSGATAVTLVPAMARQAAHVTMLQRSPSYVASRPARDAVSDRLRAVLPGKLAHRLIRTKNVAYSTFMYTVFRRWPDRAIRMLNEAVTKQLPSSIPVDPHFTPRYKPWDQRLCLVPDADLFKVLRDGSAGVVTDEIDTFTSDGIRLRSGQELEADVVVTATGLRMVALGQIELTVDGRKVDPRDTFIYKGMMLSGVPNLAWCIGYTNNSWTLRSDLTSQYVCRLLNELDRRGVSTCVPETSESAATAKPVVDLSSGYVQRAAGILPRQGGSGPWRLRQNYPRDLVVMRYSRIDDGVMQFRGVRQGRARAGAGRRTGRQAG